MRRRTRPDPLRRRSGVLSGTICVLASGVGTLTHLYCARCAIDHFPFWLFDVRFLHADR